jgi:hypothetical protein
MSKRLQVVMEDREWKEIAAAAKRRGQTVSEWVRATLRAARRSDGSGAAEKKLAAIRTAVRMNGPTADIDQMLAEIETGYRSRAE